MKEHDDDQSSRSDQSVNPRLGAHAAETSVTPPSARRSRKPKPVPDDRIAAEIAGLDAFLDTKPARQLAMHALGARCALQWVRDARQPDPMNPLRLISLTEYALDLPRVIPFTVPT